MNQYIKDRWVAALRSGDYVQGKNYLRTPEGFCCLGVLCDLHAQATDSKWDFFPGAPSHIEYLDETQNLPHEVSTWANFDDAEKLTIGEQCNDLANHNDRGATFFQIADAIEAQL